MTMGRDILVERTRRQAIYEDLAAWLREGPPIPDSRERRRRVRRYSMRVRWWAYRERRYRRRWGA